MDLNYFNKLRILDGGMGQELLANGLITKGTLWSTSAILDEKFHQLLIDVHTSFINAGANVIVTGTKNTKFETSKVSGNPNNIQFYQLLQHLQKHLVYLEVYLNLELKKVIG